jgi:hypothetical protein
MPVPASFFRSETAERIREEGRQQGRKEGFREALVENQIGILYRALRVRRFAVSDATLWRIKTSRDLELFGRWLERALTVETVEEIFDEEAYD